MTRKVKIEYYRIAYRLDGDPPNRPDRLFDLERWINSAIGINLQNRTFGYNQDQARLDRAVFIGDYGLWFLNFLRLRGNIVPSSATLTTEAEPLTLGDDEYIGEDVVGLYDADNYVLILQRNRFSIGPSGIESYLNTLWHQDPASQGEIIYLRPIRGLNALDRARHMETYRKLSIRFADIQNRHFIQNEASPLGRLIDAFSCYNAVNAEITVTVGRTRESLHPETVYDTLDELGQNRDHLTKVELAAVGIDDTRVETIDLLEDKLNDIASFRLEDREVLTNSRIADKMSDLYRNRRYEILDLVVRERRNE